MSEQDWNTLFPQRWYVGSAWAGEYNAQQFWYYPAMAIDYYAYEHFVGAIERITQAGYPTFANQPGTSREERLRELCAFFGNIAHETGRGTDGLAYREELGFERTFGGLAGSYRSVGSRTTYRMGTEPVLFRQGSQKAGQVRFTDASYHGRGPLQLSWGYNYGDYSKWLFGDPQILLDNPDRVLDEPDVGMGAAIWFWMTQPDWLMARNAHKNMYKSTSDYKTSWGFGRTIMAINGGLEGNAAENGASAASQKVTRRIAGYRRCAQHFNIQIGVNGEQLDTLGMFN